MNLKYPVNYIAITTYYKEGVHNGIDLGWNSNYGGPNQPIYSAGTGEVIAVVNNYQTSDNTGSSYGNYVKIKHDNGLETLYAHLKVGSVSVNVGDIVNENTIIGLMGDTGRADGNHLHYEVFLNNVKVNPENYTFVYPNQIVSTNKDATEGLLYMTVPEPEPTPDSANEELNKKIKELEDKITLQNKEIEMLQEELRESDTYIFKYNVTKTSFYKVYLYEGETLIIK